MRRIILTCGDPAGVGPEIIEKSLAELSYEDGQIAVAGPARWLESLRGIRPFPVGEENYEATPGSPDRNSARIAWEALETATSACLEGQADAVVTAPISKVRMREVGFTWPGHTEYFAERWGGVPVMAFRGPSLCVSLASWHIPLGDVVPSLQSNSQLVRNAVTALHGFLQSSGNQSTRIAVCGLNPHAGENGLLGDDENRWLIPQINSLQAEFPDLSGPWPADTVFWRARKGDFDGVVALYHDQGLIAVKTLEMDQAVNLTLGLRFLRTSPDHGTAYDIAGKGIADHSSFLRAVREAEMDCC